MNTRNCMMCMVIAGLLSVPLFAQEAKEKPASADDPAKAGVDAAARAAHEAAFRKTLTNAVLIGSFTVRNAKPDQQKLHEERYTIVGVEKYQGDFWTFRARITYGKQDVELPLLLEVKWAGDTPVITLEKMKIPGLGTYSARVVIYKDQYVGVWDAGDHGGQMFGRIERGKDGGGEGVEGGDGEKKSSQ